MGYTFVTTMSSQIVVWLSFPHERTYPKDGFWGSSSGLGNNSMSGVFKGQNMLGKWWVIGLLSLMMMCKLTWVVM